MDSDVPRDLIPIVQCVGSSSDGSHVSRGGVDFFIAGVQLEPGATYAICDTGEHFLINPPPETLPVFVRSLGVEFDDYVLTTQEHAVGRKNHASTAIEGQWLRLSEDGSVAGSISSTPPTTDSVPTVRTPWFGYSVERQRVKDAYERFHKRVSEGKPPLNSGVVLYGPPGTGKTTMARQIAADLNLTAHEVDAPALLSKWVGEAEMRIAEAFETCRNSGSIMLIDEVETIGGVRDDSGSSSKTAHVLLTEISGIKDKKPVFIIATTNRIDLVDEAITRTGRLGLKVNIPLPRPKDRSEIISGLLDGVAIPPDLLEFFVAASEGRTSSDLAYDCGDLPPPNAN